MTRPRTWGPLAVVVPEVVGLRGGDAGYPDVPVGEVRGESEEPVRGAGLRAFWSGGGG